ncbi:MerR family transcriptional regulator [Rossellomorea marisflavi]|uniref:MerR family transcriptional regulator n=2 Tax=Rossellomorea marisflavi TaxID=189381 RepID=UPI0006F987A7|nr:MerR family transcriptional regulator [Rossellomorea marisflavi]KQU63579.1 MerR family transcriptional regulator [Bacillus sp. Leaf406]MDW4525697.1 MerR family transcriptional regulator [Rossellomorea marisflavi]UKS67440.1 MerR family transcriptional regulator [Rossellomorea marisflavi]VXC27554.1 MerR family transcriptional regulator [Bacillus sp. 349Y]
MTYSMKQITEMTGVPASALRYYEKESILPFVERNDKGIRVYDDVNVEWIYFIRALRETDMPIREIKKYVALYMEGDATKEERRKLLLQHEENVEAKLSSQFEYLKRIKKKLVSYGEIEKNLQ